MHRPRGGTGLFTILATENETGAPRQDTFYYTLNLFRGWPRQDISRLFKQVNRFPLPETDLPAAQDVLRSVETPFKFLKRKVCQLATPPRWTL